MLRAMPQAVRRVRVRYLGRVQGVGFRATARSIAGRHPISGWVRNESDGSVTLEAQADPEALERFLGEVRSSMAGLIASESTDPVAPVESESAFVITF